LRGRPCQSFNYHRTEAILPPVRKQTPCRRATHRTCASQARASRSERRVSIEHRSDAQSDHGQQTVCREPSLRRRPGLSRCLVCESRSSLFGKYSARPRNWPGTRLRVRRNGNRAGCTECHRATPSAELWGQGARGERSQANGPAQRRLWRRGRVRGRWRRPWRRWWPWRPGWRWSTAGASLVNPEQIQRLIPKSQGVGRRLGIFFG
jgi:hypothetical protein